MGTNKSSAKERTKTLGVIFLDNTRACVKNLMSQTILAFDVNIAGVGSQLMPVAPPSRVETAVEVCTIVTIFGLHDCH